MGTLTTTQVTYPINRLVNVFEDVALKTVRAYHDSNTGLPQDMEIGATGDVNIETLNDMNITYSNAINVYDSKNGNSRILQISSPDTNTIISSLTNDVYLTTGNNLIGKVNVGSTEFSESNDFQVLKTSKSNGFLFQSPLVLNSSPYIAGNLVVQNNIFGQTLNAIRTHDPAIHPQNARLTGYSFVINDLDQLELLRYHTFADDSSVTQRVALFGRGSVTSNDLSDYDYLGYQGLSNIGILPYNPGYAPPTVPVAYDSSGNALVDSAYLANLSNILLSTRGSLTTLNTRFLGLSNHTSSITTLTEGLIATTSVQSNNLAILSTSLDALSFSLSTTNSDLAAHKTWAQNNSNSLNYRISTLSNSHTNVAQRVASLEDQFVVVLDRNDEAIAAVSDMIPRINSLSNTTSLLTSDVADLHTGISNVNHNYMTLTSTVNNVNSTMNNVTYSIANLSSGLTGLDVRVTNLSNQHFTLLSRFNTVADTYPTTTSTLTSLSNSTRTLASTLTSLSNHTTLLSASHAALNSSFLVHSNLVRDTLYTQALTNSSLCNQLDQHSGMLQELTLSNQDVTSDLAALSNSFTSNVAAQSQCNQTFQSQLATHAQNHTNLSNVARTNFQILYGYHSSNVTAYNDLLDDHNTLAASFEDFLNESYYPFSNDIAPRIIGIEGTTLPLHNSLLELAAQSNSTLSSEVDYLRTWSSNMSNDIIYLYESNYQLSNALNDWLYQLQTSFDRTSNQYRIELDANTQSNAETLDQLLALSDNHDDLYEQVQHMSNVTIPHIRSDLDIETASNKSLKEYLLSFERGASNTLSNMDADHDSLYEFTHALSSSYDAFVIRTDASIGNLDEDVDKLFDRTDTLFEITGRHTGQISELYTRSSNTDIRFSTFSNSAQSNITINTSNISVNASNVRILQESNLYFYSEIGAVRDSHNNTRQRFLTLSSNYYSELLPSYESLSNSYGGLSNWIRNEVATMTSSNTASFSSNSADIAALYSSNAQLKTTVDSNASTLGNLIADLWQASSNNTSNIASVTDSNSTLTQAFASLSNTVASNVQSDITKLLSLTGKHTTDIATNTSNIGQLFSNTVSLAPLSNATRNYILSNNQDVSALQSQTSILRTDVNTLSNDFYASSNELFFQTSNINNELEILRNNLSSLPTGNNISELRTSITNLSNYTYSNITPAISELRRSFTTLNDKHDEFEATVLNQMTLRDDTISEHTSALEALDIMLADSNTSYVTFSNQISLKVEGLSDDQISLSNDIRVALQSLQVTTINNTVADLETNFSELSNATATLCNNVEFLLNNIDLSGPELKPDAVITEYILDGAVTNSKIRTDFIDDRFQETYTYNLNFKAFRYPPQPFISSNTQTISTSVYGNGTYSVSASSSASTSTADWRGFDNDLSTTWRSAAVYSSGLYTGATSTPFFYTSDLSTTRTALGEYLQIDLPIPLMLQKYSMLIQSGASVFPKSWILLGWNTSRTPNRWVQLDAQTNNQSLVAGAHTDFAIRVNQTVTKLRIVVNSLSGGTQLSIADLSFYVIENTTGIEVTNLNYYRSLRLSDESSLFMGMSNNTTYFQTPVVFMNGDYIDSQGAKITLQTNVINSNAFMPGAVDTTAIADGAVTENKLGTYSVTSMKIAPDNVRTVHIEDLNITAQKLGQASVTSFSLSNKSVGNEHMQDESIDRLQLRASSVTSNAIADATIINSKLANNSVTRNNIQDRAVSSAKIELYTIDSNNIRSLGIGVNNFDDASISTNKLQDKCVTTDKISDNAVTAAKLLQAGVDEKIKHFNMNNLVGFNVASPTERLDVNGNIKLSGNVTQTSDIRLKDDIRPITNALDKVSSLTGYTYRLKTEEESGKRHAGLIAQEVLQVLPEVVSGNAEKGSSNYLSLSYGNLVALLVQAMKEMKQELDALRLFVSASSANRNELLISES